MADERDVSALVSDLLASAGISPPSDEAALFAFMYPVLRAKADRIYEIDLGDEA